VRIYHGSRSLPTDLGSQRKCAARRKKIKTQLDAVIRAPRFDQKLYNALIDEHALRSEELQAREEHCRAQRDA